MPQVGEGIKGLVVGSSGEFYNSEYAKAYDKAFGEAPTTAFGAYAYDSALLTGLALQKAGKATSDAIRDALTPVAENSKAVTGGTTFDKHGMQVDTSYPPVTYHEDKQLGTAPYRGTQ